MSLYGRLDGTKKTEDKPPFFFYSNLFNYLAIDITNIL